MLVRCRVVKRPCEGPVPIGIAGGGEAGEVAEHLEPQPLVLRAFVPFVENQLDSVAEVKTEDRAIAEHVGHIGRVECAQAVARKLRVKHVELNRELELRADLRVLELVEVRRRKLGNLGDLLLARASEDDIRGDLGEGNGRFGKIRKRVLGNGSRGEFHVSADQACDLQLVILFGDGQGSGLVDLAEPHEESGFIPGETEDRRNLVEVAGRKRVGGLLGEEIPIENRPPAPAGSFRGIEAEVRPGRQGVEDFLGRLGSHAGENVLVLGATERPGERIALCLSRLESRPGALARTTLQDGLVKETCTLRGGEMAAHAERPGRLPEDRHVLGIATKRRDVLLDPAKRGHLVHQAIVPGRPGLALGRKRRVREQTELPKAVVHAHHDRVGLLRDEFAGSSAVGLDAFAEGEAATMDPDHDRQVATCRGRVDVDVEAIFAGHEARNREAVEGRLDAAVRPLGGRKRFGPGRRFYGRLPAELAERRRGIGNAPIREDALVLEALDRAEARLHEKLARCGTTGASGATGAALPTAATSTPRNKGSQEQRTKNRSSNHLRPR